MIKKITIALVIILVLALAGKFLLGNFDGLFQLPSGRDGNSSSAWKYEIKDGKTVITAYNGRTPVLTIPKRLTDIRSANSVTVFFPATQKSKR